MNNKIIKTIINAAAEKNELNVKSQELLTSTVGSYVQNYMEHILTSIKNYMDEDLDFRISPDEPEEKLLFEMCINRDIFR